MDNNYKFNYKLFGLESRDLNVYHKMLKFREPTSIRSIAEQAHLNRGTTFEIIKKLILMGMVVSQYKNKRKYYAAQHPSALRDYAIETHQKIVDQLDQVDSYVKHLENTRQLEITGQFTQFYEGEDEIAVLLHDVLDTVSKQEIKEYYAISSAEIRNHLYPKFRNFTRQRIKRKIYTKVIAIGEGGELAELAERRYLSSDKLPACYVIIYGDKVAQISLSEAGNIQGVVVQNPGVKQLQLIMFDHIWASL